MAEPPTTLQIVTVAVAVYAAILSTLTGVVQIFNYRRDRARIKVTVGHEMQMFLDPKYSGKTLTIVKVLNKGRRPVTITSVGASRLYPRPHFVIVDCRPPLPYQLTEGTSLVGILTVEKADDYANIDSWLAQDAVGGTYKLHVAPWYARVISHARLRLALRRRRHEKGKS